MKTRKKWYKNIIAAVISFAMVIGIFSSMQMEAKAANNYSVDVTDSDSIENAKATTYYPGDTLTITNIEKYPGYNPDQKSDYVCAISVNVWVADKSFMFSPEYDTTNHTATYTFPTNIIDYQNLSFKLKYIKVTPDSKYCDTKLLFSSDEATPSSETDSETASSTPSDISSSQTGSEVASPIPSHECSFQWVTTVEPQPGVDGLEEYKCMSCGMVKESQPIPASMASVKNLYGFIKDAPENGTVTTDFGKLHTISDYLLKKMAERNDATVTIQFEYKNQKLQITFPAGTDYTPVLNDTDTMYGFYGVAAKLGLTVTERQ